MVAQETQVTQQRLWLLAHLRLWWAAFWVEQMKHPVLQLQKTTSASRFIVEWLLWVPLWEGKQERLEPLS